MKQGANHKTTIAGILKVLAAAGGLLGISITPEQQENIIAGWLAVHAIISAVQGYLTKDKD